MLDAMFFRYGCVSFENACLRLFYELTIFDCRCLKILLMFNKKYGTYYKYFPEEVKVQTCF